MSIKNTVFLKAVKLGLSGDKKGLLALLQEIAAHEVNNNRYGAYRDLMELLEHHKDTQSQGKYVLSGKLTQVINEDQLKRVSIWLPTSTRQKLDRFIKIHSSDKLDGVDFSYFNKLLFYGPAGSGKTTLAFYLSALLNKSIRYIKISDLLSFRFGETMKNIEKVFEETKEDIIFIDEFDALAKTRNDSGDIGELKRIVNSLIQTLDLYSNTRIIIVATNLVNTIDAAIVRRFAFKISIGVLSKQEIKEFLIFLLNRRESLKSSMTTEDIAFLSSIFDGLDVNTIDGIRSLVEKTLAFLRVEGKKEIKLDDFVESIFSEDYLNDSKNKIFNKYLIKKIGIKLENLGYTKKEISSMLGIHRNSYYNAFKEDDQVEA